MPGLEDRRANYYSRESDPSIGVVLVTSETVNSGDDPVCNESAVVDPVCNESAVVESDPVDFPSSVTT